VIPQAPFQNTPLSSTLGSNIIANTALTYSQSPNTVTAFTPMPPGGNTTGMSKTTVSPFRLRPQGGTAPFNTNKSDLSLGGTNPAPYDNKLLKPL
jgi:hypothetical protein